MSTLKFDATTVQSTRPALLSAAARVPFTGTNSATGCGSAAVEDAVTGFLTWLTRRTRIQGAGLDDLAGSLDRLVAAWDTTDAQLGGNARRQVAV